MGNLTWIASTIEPLGLSNSTFGWLIVLMVAQAMGLFVYFITRNMGACFIVTAVILMLAAFMGLVPLWAFALFAIPSTLYLLPRLMGLWGDILDVEASSADEAREIIEDGYSLTSFNVVDDEIDDVFEIPQPIPDTANEQKA